MTSFHLQEATIDDIHAAYRSGAISVRELVQLYIARIEAYDQQGPTLNSIQIMNPRVLEEADAFDARLKSGGIDAPLFGLPVLLKDQFETDDMPTSYGSAIFKGYMSGRNANIVDKLKAAGAFIIAKTNMGEFAAGCVGSAHGWVRNPYDPRRDPSGSSAGTGAAIAADFGVIGVGEDTTGSIRGPAARCSSVGIRPTLPLISRFGMMPANPTRDTAGPIMRTVRDTAKVFDAMVGYDPRDPITAYGVGNTPETYMSYLREDGLRGKRLGVIRDAFAPDTDTSAPDHLRVRATIDRALGELANCGAEIIDPVVVPDICELLAQTTVAFEPEPAINAYLAQLPNPPVTSLQEIVLHPDILLHQSTRLLRSVNHSTNDIGYLKLQQVRETLRLNVLKAMADANLDALIYATFDHEPQIIPDDVLTAPKNGLQKGSNRALAPMLVFPGISVPAGYTEGELPVGIEFLGRPYSDGLLFQIAYAYEQATRYRKPPSLTPPLPGAP